MLTTQETNYEIIWPVRLENIRVKCWKKHNLFKQVSQGRKRRRERDREKEKKIGSGKRKERERRRVFREKI